MATFADALEHQHDLGAGDGRGLSREGRGLTTGRRAWAVPCRARGRWTDTAGPMRGLCVPHPSPHGG